MNLLALILVIVLIAFLLSPGQRANGNNLVYILLVVLLVVLIVQALPAGGIYIGK